MDDEDRSAGVTGQVGDGRGGWASEAAPATIRERFAQRKPGPHTLKLILGPLIAFVIAANVGDAMAPTLVDTHPLTLLSLNARNRNLILVTNQLDAVSYYVVGFVRLLASDPLFYLLGWYFGDRAVAWIEDRSNHAGRFMRSMEGFFGKAAYPLVVVMPNNFICLFAGSSGMAIGTFFALNAIGTVGRLYLIRWLGEAFEKPIDAVLDFIADYRPYLLATTVAFVVYTVWSEARSGKGEIGELLHLEEDLEGDLDAQTSDDRDAPR